MIAMTQNEMTYYPKVAEHADNAEEQDSTELTIGERTFKLANPWSGCKAEVLAGDSGEIYMFCLGSARVYEMSATEAKTLADDLQRACAGTSPSPSD